MGKKLTLEQVRTDGGTQAREALDEPTIASYAADMKAGHSFPPVVVFYDGKSYWLADGFHRLEATRRAERDGIVADVRMGTQRDAVLFACGANRANALRRTNADKRKAVERMLRDQEWAKWSDRKIAEHVGVSNNMVSEYRSRLSSDDSQPTAREGRDGRTINTNGIGKGREEPPAKPQPEPATPKKQTLFEPEAKPEEGPAYPHSDIMAERITDSVLLLCSVNRLRGGNIETMLREPEKWDKERIAEDIIPGLEDLQELVENYLKGVRTLCE